MDPEAVDEPAGLVPGPDGVDKGASEVGLISGDVVLLLHACSVALNDRVLARTRDAVAGRRVSMVDGYVFQHLIPGRVSITGLAERLGVSQQAASKQVADLEERGLVRRIPDPDDGRARLVELTALGWDAVTAARVARQEIAAELAELLGADGLASLQSALRAVSDHTGAAAVMGRRQVRPESQR